MANNLATDVLLIKRQELLDEKSKMNEIFDAQIQQIETSIERLEGKNVWELASTTLYDDESHNYIRSSQEEI
jgi:hypothetical protein